jgi:hypothetical protein
VVAHHTAARSGRSACAPFARAQAQLVMAMVDASRSAPARARGESRFPRRSVTTPSSLPDARPRVTQAPDPVPRQRPREAENDEREERVQAADHDEDEHLQAVGAEPWRPTSSSSTSACRRPSPTRARVRPRRSRRRTRSSGSSSCRSASRPPTRWRSSSAAASAACSRTAGEFLAAAERIARGGSALDPKVVARLVSPDGDDDPLAELTGREREVLMHPGATQSS